VRKELLLPLMAWFGCILWFSWAASGAPLQSDELLLIYNAADRESREVAVYYANTRNVPADQVLGLELNTRGEEMPADEFEAAVRAPIRAYLEQRGLREKVRCLVTFYGVPIRVSARPQSPQRAKLLEQRKEEFRAVLAEFRAIVGELDSTATRPARRPSRPAEPEIEWRQLQQKYGQARQLLAEQAGANAGTAEGRAVFAKLLQTVQQIEGTAALVAQMSVSGDAPADHPTVRQLQAVKERLKADDERLKEALARDVEDPARAEGRELLRQNHGLNGLLLALQEEMLMLRDDETQAALDSELALLWWDQYPRHRWVMNSMNWRYRAGLAARNSPPPARPPVLMVSRIDGPTSSIARGLIDKALAGEKAGPTGRAYFDARGMNAKKEGFGPYDEALRQIAGTVRSKTSIAVRLDNREKLFGRGECPNTVLYCGWYSLRRYIDAFTFVPGAVGYHLASFEAISLKKPGEQGWCKRMLEDGITATLGPVAEPYLQSFPRPDDFFGLLLTGRFTLAEVYAYTVPFHSWMQMLIGDPLYRPFAKSPPLKLEDALPPEIIPAEYQPGTRAE